MPRRLRFSPPNSVHHVINRGNERRLLFDDFHDFGEFRELVAWAKSKIPLRIIAYSLMPNHWHFIVWPEESDSISRFFQLLCTTHAIKRRRETGTVGYGHVYQGRYKAFLIHSETYLFRAMRYVEANPFRAGLVKEASEWPWSSFHERRQSDRVILDDGPLPLPDNWDALVTSPLPTDFIEDFHKNVRRH
jgi:putative transposase